MWSLIQSDHSRQSDTSGNAVSCSIMCCRATLVVVYVKTTLASLLALPGRRFEHNCYRGQLVIYTNLNALHNFHTLPVFSIFYQKQ